MFVRVTWKSCYSLCLLDPEGWSVPRPECCKTQHSPDRLTLSSACSSAQSCLLPCRTSRDSVCEGRVRRQSPP